jgi:hypothetical protein
MVYVPLEQPVLLKDDSGFWEDESLFIIGDFHGLVTEM